MKTLPALVNMGRELDVMSANSGSHARISLKISAARKNTTCDTRASILNAVSIERETNGKSI